MEEKDLGFRFWNLLRDASVNTEYMMTDFSARSKLSRLQCRTLLQIFIQEKVRLSDLAVILGMNPGNHSVQLPSAGRVHRPTYFQAFSEPCRQVGAED